MTRTSRLDALTAGMLVPYGGDRYTTVSDELAAAFEPGDQLHVVQDTGALLHVPADVLTAVRNEVDGAVAAFEQMRVTPWQNVQSFFIEFAQRLEDAWGAIAEENAKDVERAASLGRSTTRLGVTDQMRDEMAAGLRGWAEVVARRIADPDADIVDRVEHDTWSVEIARAPLGVVAFVFEGRPNVLADAAGVVATGNTAVLRIGGDALGTARAIVDTALDPALRAAGLPEGVISLVPVRDRSAGWALFSDSRLALAVVRGSGAAVTQLSSVARQSGVPVSAHGTGGAWLVAHHSADAQRLAGVVRHSLDRKVCNTLNVAVLPADRAADLMPVLLAAADEAAASRTGTARVHVVEGSQGWVPAGEFERTIEVERAEGTINEPRADVIAVDQLGHEWEWENTPEFSVVVVEDLDEAVRLFNEHSPQFVASLIAEDSEAHERFIESANAPFVGDGFTRWVDGQYALDEPELGLSNWEHGRLLARGGILSGADLTTRRLYARHKDPNQHR